MAIDTAAKRKSISGIGMQFTAPGITNDATPDVFWRQTSAWNYSGIAVTGGVVEEVLQQLAWTWLASPNMKATEWDWVGR